MATRSSFKLMVTVSWILICLVISSISVRAISDKKIMLVEVQTTGANDASAEFVKVINQGLATVALDGWKLQYKSAAGSSWTTKASLVGSLDPGAEVLLATSKFVTAMPHQTMTDGLAQAGGHLQLVDELGQTHDLLGWGTALYPELAAAPAPDKEQSLTRKSLAGSYIDTDNNSLDFSLEVMPPPPPPKPVPSAPPTSSNPPTVTAAAADPNVGLSPPQITEILPNPKTPQTDADDEFVEIYNPNPSKFRLKGYKLQTGSNYSYSLTFNDEELAAHSYFVVTSGNSSLTLSNSGGAARIVNSGGQTISQAENYDKAEAGQAWALIDGRWQWSSSPTPGQPNTLAAENDASNRRTLASTTTKASSSSKAQNSPKALDKADQETKPEPNIHKVVIALIGTLGLGYAVYEYRHDIGNIVYKLRRYRENRRVDRQASQGRRSY
jgi:Lamin Tail Domain